jgi:hypothetical protein
LFQVDALPGLPPQRTMGEHAHADAAIALGVIDGLQSVILIS